MSNSIRMLKAEQRRVRGSNKRASEGHRTHAKCYWSPAAGEHTSAFQIYNICAYRTKKTMRRKCRVIQNFYEANEGTRGNKPQLTVTNFT